MALTTVIQGMLANDAVISTTISAENVRDFDIALSAVRTRHIQDFAIQTYHLSSNVIDSRVIASSAVTTRHYAASSIQNVHLSAACVRTLNIAASAVTVDKLNLDVFQNLRGSKIFYNDRSSLIIANSNYLSAHGAIIVNRYSDGTNNFNNYTTIQLEDSSDPVPGNFHCWILNTSRQHIRLVGGASRPLRYDARKFTILDNNANTVLVSGSYFDGGFRYNSYSFIYAFYGKEVSGLNVNDVIYVTSYNGSF